MGLVGEAQASDRSATFIMGQLTDNPNACQQGDGWVSPDAAPPAMVRGVYRDCCRSACTEPDR